MLTATLSNTLTAPLSGVVEIPSVLNGSSEAFDFTSSNPSTALTGSQYSFNRGTNAMMNRSGDGWLVYAPNNTNYPSANFSVSRYTKTGSTATLSDVTPPQNLTRCYKLIEDNSTGNHNVIGPSNTMVEGSYYSGSIFAKAGERTRIRLQLGPAASFGGINPSVTVNLIDGTFTSAGGGNPQVTNAGNGWWRIGTSKIASGGTTAQINALIVNDSGSVSYAGDGSSGVIIAGAQFEIGPYVQAYSETSGSAEYYGPRFDTNPVTLQPLGYLSEKQSTNLLLWSNDQSNAVWTLANTTITTTSSGPDGVSNSSQMLTPSATNTTHGGTQQFTTVSGSVYTVYYIVKASGYNWFQIGGSAGFDSVNQWQNYNLSNGTLGSKGSATFSAGISPLANGYYLCWMSATAGSSVANANMYFRILDQDYASRNPAWTGDGVGGVLMFGAQAEANRSRPSSFIPTYASQATRGADDMSVAIGSWYNPSEGTLLTEYSLQYDVSIALISNDIRGSAMLSDGTTQARIADRAQQSANGGGLAFVANSGTLVVQTSFTGNTANTLQKMAISYATNNTIAARNGVLGALDTDCIIPTGITLFSIGSEYNTNQTDGYIRRVAYYPTRKSDSETQSITV